MKYKIIKTKSQYKEYCKILEESVYKAPKSKSIKDEIELLTFLIKKWDEEHSPFSDKGPIELIQALMEENNLKPKDLVEILGVSKGLVSDILSYKKGLSKSNIRILALHFKISQEALNKSYQLKKQLQYV